MSKKQTKKEKITYIDDGRTLADMSGVTGGFSSKSSNSASSGFARFRDCWKTYWAAVRMMFVPMLVTMGILCVMFLVAFLVFRFL